MENQMENEMEAGIIQGLYYIIALQHPTRRQVDLNQGPHLLN